jgi:signal transduction histidine kinase
MENAGPEPSLVDRLAAHKALDGVPREQLEWLVSHGALRQFAAGEVINQAGNVIPELFVVLSGHISITGDRGAGPRKLKEWRGGDISGFLPFSRMTGAPGIVIAEQPTEALTVHRDHFRELICECYDVASVLVHEMIDRARLFRSNELHDEKMVSLGRLSARLVHDLNNPASAVLRSAKHLAASLGELDEASRALAAASWTSEQLDAINRLRDASPPSPSARGHSPLELADREDAVAEWLERHGVDPALAEPLGQSDIPLTALDDLADRVDRTQLPLALRCVAVHRAARRLTAEIEAGASRVFTLASAVKRYAYLDQSTMPKAVDLQQDLADTFALLNSKARAKSIELRMDIAPNLPPIQALGGELNQVWQNLVDNALDAVATGGHVTVTAAREDGSIVVRVIDDGPGIAEEHRGRIFEPFFTTKPKGDGTGLGLEIAKRLVNRQGGHIDFTTGPGGTEFRVTLPLSEGHQARATKGEIG